MVTAIDGPAGAGKSSVARYIAETFGFLNLNSGLYYRAVTAAVLKNGIDPQDPRGVAAAAENVDYSALGEEVLRTDEVDKWSAVVSSFPAVRTIINAQLRKKAQSVDLVAEGRDMTTLVFPEAEIKIYLDGDPLVRAKRRLAQGTSALGLAQIQKAMEERDRTDRNKAWGSLRIAEDARIINTSDLTLNEVYAIVSEIIKEHLQSHSQE